MQEGPILQYWINDSLRLPNSAMGTLGVAAKAGQIASSKIAQCPHVSYQIVLDNPAGGLRKLKRSKSQNL